MNETQRASSRAEEGTSPFTRIRELAVWRIGLIPNLSLLALLKAVPTPGGYVDHRYLWVTTGVLLTGVVVGAALGPPRTRPLRTRRRAVSLLFAGSATVVALGSVNYGILHDHHRNSIELMFTASVVVTSLAVLTVWTSIVMILSDPVTGAVDADRSWRALDERELRVRHQAQAWAYKRLALVPLGLAAVSIFALTDMAQPIRIYSDFVQALPKLGWIALAFALYPVLPAVPLAWRMPSDGDNASADIRPVAS